MCWNNCLYHVYSVVLSTSPLDDMHCSNTFYHLNCNTITNWYFVTRLTRRVSLVKQELLTPPEHLISPSVFSGVRVTRSLVFCVCFVDRCFSFCPFPFGHCVVCSSIYAFRLPLWYLQSLHYPINGRIIRNCVFWLYSDYLSTIGNLVCWLEIWYVDRYLTFFNIIRIPLPYEFGILISSSLVINHNLIWL